MKNRIINLKSEDYYTQRNNNIRPNAACMPTSRVMFYRGNGIKYSNPSDLSDDDYFMSLFQGQKVKEIAEQKYSWSKGTPPNQVHGMYHTWLDPKVCGRRTSDFKTDLSIDDYVDLIKKGQVIMTSGKFPGIDGHAFCVIGWDGENLLLADPWGNHSSAYKSHKGYIVPLSVDEFHHIVKPVKHNRKWGHVLI